MRAFLFLFTTWPFVKINPQKFFTHITTEKSKAPKNHGSNAVFKASNHNSTRKSCIPHESEIKTGNR